MVRSLLEYVLARKKFPARARQMQVRRCPRNNGSARRASLAPPHDGLLKPYQFTFSANWNCRGSYAAVGCPALVNNGFTADVLFLFARLNMSTIASGLIRSQIGRAS